MATFKAEMDVDNLKILITCDTFWACTCDGNILLSKFSGIGDDEIDLLKDGNTWLYNGNITFTYGDEHCYYPVLQIAYNDFCTISTIPSYLLCVDDNNNTKNVLYFKYSTQYDTFSFTVDSAIDRWELYDTGGHTYFISGNDIMIVANTTNDFVIKPTDCDDETKYVYVIMVKSE